ncbi:hypothetical protein D0894_26080 [Pseudomonas monteilii]|uniref:Uncharacterized protein n=1 Tax=Pseudomonas monteilii TaxID=76759 RepID=A0A399LYB5_9PSED|nr:hypothetical protein D0894_26080 [Pseudomonas monteilii]
MQGKRAGGVRALHLRPRVQLVPAYRVNKNAAHKGGVFHSGPCRLLRGLARSHRETTGFRPCEHPVEAGEPAKRPAQIYRDFSKIFELR